MAIYYRSYITAAVWPAATLKLYRTTQKVGCTANKMEPHMLLLRDHPAFDDFAERLRTAMNGLCFHDFTNTRALLTELNHAGYAFDVTGTLAYLTIEGAGCDCEVLKLAGVPLEPAQPDEMQEPDPEDAGPFARQYAEAYAQRMQRAGQRDDLKYVWHGRRRVRLE
jgi:hypothetical protein